MRYLEKIITTTSDVFFKANSHNTVWMSHTNLCVTSLNLFRISPWQGKRAKICFKCNLFCLLKSPAGKMKHNSLSWLKHMILISKLQKMGRLKCHTQTFEDFYLSSSLIWLFGTNSPLKRHSKLWHSCQNMISCFLGFNIHSLLWIVPLDWCVTHMRHTLKIFISHLCMKK